MILHFCESIKMKIQKREKILIFNCLRDYRIREAASQYIRNCGKGPKGGWDSALKITGEIFNFQLCKILRCFASTFRVFNTRGVVCDIVSIIVGCSFFSSSKNVWRQLIGPMLVWNIHSIISLHNLEQVCSPQLPQLTGGISQR